MTTEEIIKQNGTQNLINELRNLETQNLLKDAFIGELTEVFDSAYDKDFNLTETGKNSIIDFITNNLDGTKQTTRQLVDTNHYVNSICKIIEQQQEIKINHYKPLN